MDSHPHAKAACVDSGKRRSSDTTSASNIKNSSNSLSKSASASSLSSTSSSSLTHSSKDSPKEQTKSPSQSKDILPSVETDQCTGRSTPNKLVETLSERERPVPESPSKLHLSCTNITESFTDTDEDFEKLIIDMDIKVTDADNESLPENEQMTSEDGNQIQCGVSEPVTSPTIACVVKDNVPTSETTAANKIVTKPDLKNLKSHHQKPEVRKTILCDAMPLKQRRSSGKSAGNPTPHKQQRKTSSGTSPLTSPRPSEPWIVNTSRDPISPTTRPVRTDNIFDITLPYGSDFTDDPVQQECEFPDVQPDASSTETPVNQKPQETTPAAASADVRNKDQVKEVTAAVVNEDVRDDSQGKDASCKEAPVNKKSQETTPAVVSADIRDSSQVKEASPTTEQEHTEEVQQNTQAALEKEKSVESNTQSIPRNLVENQSGTLPVPNVTKLVVKQERDDGDYSDSDTASVVSGRNTPVPVPPIKQEKLDTTYPDQKSTSPESSAEKESTSAVIPVVTKMEVSGSVDSNEDEAPIHGGFIIDEEADEDDVRIMTYVGGIQDCPWTPMPPTPYLHYKGTTYLYIQCIHIMTLQQSIYMYL